MMNFGFIGIGQGGGNIVNCFGKDFPTIAINTAPNDLEGLNNIPKHQRILAKVTEGGAGKSIRYGEKAILTHQNQIVDTIKLSMGDVDRIWLVAGLGGGSGSLGLIQTSILLSKMGKRHSVIVTLPTDDEGTVEKVNSIIALKQLYDLHGHSKNFQSYLIVDNNELKKRILDSGQFTYERFWDEANSLIYRQFKMFYDLSRLSGTTAFDTEDYKSMFDEKGGLVFAESFVDISSGDNALAAAVMQSWRDTVFVSGDVTQATAIAVVVQRPTGFDKGGQEINTLFEKMKEQIGSGKFCRGVYYNDSILDKAAGAVGQGKPVKISSVVAGIPFPVNIVADLKGQVDREIADIKQKQRRDSLDLDIGSYLSFVDQNNGENDSIEELDFTIFNKKTS